MRTAPMRHSKPVPSICTLVALLALTPRPCAADQVTGARLREVGFDQRLNAQVPLDVTVRDESGKTVRLGDLFHGKPVILTLNYYNCPMLCTIELNGLLRSIQTLNFTAGDEFEIITLSIDPRETPALASAKKASYLRRYGRPKAARGWHFLTADEASIKAITRAVGFRYLYDSKSEQFAHPAGILVLTPQGKAARYFYGLEYPPKDLRLGLIEASAGKIGSPVDQILLLCFHYDPATGKYSFVIMNILRLLAALTVLSLGTFMVLMLRREWRRARARSALELP